MSIIRIFCVIINLALLMINALLRLVFTRDGVGVEVIIRSVELMI